jgi:hypothetical protein
VTTPLSFDRPASYQAIVKRRFPTNICFRVLLTGRILSSNGSSKEVFPAEDVLFEITRSSDGEIEESEDSDEGDMLEDGKDDPILYR